VDAQAHDYAVKDHGNDDGLDAERYGSGDIEMRRLLNVGLPRHGERDDERMQREDIDEGKDAVLVQQHEADEHEAAGEEVGDVQFQMAHYTLRETNRSNAASKPSIRATPRKSETRNTRILAVTVSKTASRKPPTASLST